MADKNKNKKNGGTLKGEEIIANINEALNKSKSKAFKLLFFVMDTKGAPSGELAYIYETAYYLLKQGYDVHMLHAEEEFVGVGEWLGEQYMTELPHHYTEKDQVDISPSDFLFIPEVYASVMTQTKQLPCRRVVIVQNYNMLTESIPFGATFDDLGIKDCITTTNVFKDKLTTLFPNLKVRVVSPKINEGMFNVPEYQKKLIVNVISKDGNTLNNIVKTFMWKYPIYKWVSFRNVGNINRQEFADLLQEAAITVWSDSNTDFGYSALEAMACGSLVIGRIPEDKSDWIYNENGKVKDNAVWYYTNEECVDRIASVIQTFLYDSVPQNFIDEGVETAKVYSTENMERNIQTEYVEGLFAQRAKELEIALSSYKNYLSKDNASENNSEK